MSLCPTILLLASYPLAYGFTPQNLWSIYKSPSYPFNDDVIDNPSNSIDLPSSKLLFEMVHRRKRRIVTTFFMTSSADDEEEVIHLDDESSYAFFQPRTQVSLSTPQSKLERDKRDVVRRWLLFYLPKLKPKDVEVYTKALMGDGFDSEEMLMEVVEEDLDFMKVVRFVYVERCLCDVIILLFWLIQCYGLVFVCIWFVFMSLFYFN